MIFPLTLSLLLAPQESDEQAIREARAASNRAIAEHDAEALARFWTEDVHVVTSTSAQASGRETERQAFEAQFRARPDVSYLREPSRVEVFPPWEMASELGEWKGRWSEPDGVVEIGGSYFAKWRKQDGRWLIQAEIFVPLYCRGSSYCGRKP